MTPEAIIVGLVGLFGVFCQLAVTAYFYGRLTQQVTDQGKTLERHEKILERRADLKAAAAGGRT